MRLPGNRFSIDEANSGDNNFRTISIEMVSPREGAPLVNVADKLGSGWFDYKSNHLRLKFHMVVLFSEAPIDQFVLMLRNGGNVIPLPAAPSASPTMRRKFPEVSWSDESRFTVDTTLDIPEGVRDTDNISVVAIVAGEERNIATIHLADEQSFQVVPSSETIFASPRIFVDEPSHSIPLVNEKPFHKIVSRLRTVNRIFLGTVVIPTFISIVYFGLAASDVYVSESRFIIRSPDKQTLSPLGMMLKGVDFGRSQDDSYLVQGFILSRDALHTLVREMDIGKKFSDENIDLFSRFGGLEWDTGFESLYKYYQTKVDVQIDSTSSIATLVTRGFTAHDSQKANELLLTMSEDLVNQLNEKGRQDMIRFAEREVAEAEKLDQKTTLALARMQTGGVKGGGTVAGKFAEYQRISLEKQYADQLLATALAGLQDARNQAVRKQLYLERISQPSLPDRAMEPRRVKSILAVFVLGLVLWGVLSMLIAGIREHQD